MKNEPLKNKIITKKVCYQEGSLDCYKCKCDGCSKKDFWEIATARDIKSAVSWLKQEITKEMNRINKFNDFDKKEKLKYRRLGYVWYLDLIDKAFEDVK